MRNIICLRGELNEGDEERRSKGCLRERHDSTLLRTRQKTATLKAAASHHKTNLGEVLATFLK